MYDIIFCTLPVGWVHTLYPAPAILKGVCNQYGFKSFTKDFNLELYKLCDRDESKYKEIQNYFIGPRYVLSKEQQHILDQWYKNQIDFFKNNPTKHIGISIFSVCTHKATIEFINLLKQNNIQAKIIAGGRGAKTPIWSTVAGDLKIDKTIDFGDALLNARLIDKLVIGDGEEGIIDALQGQIIRKEYYLDNFNYPIPDYSNYEFENYNFPDDIAFPITGSRGCVRNCDFCDIRAHFGRYKFRSGIDVANEMIHIAETLGYKKFEFTDSLVNGSLKTFEEFMTIIAEYNNKNPGRKLTWHGQYICRPEKQQKERVYKLIAESGGEGLSIGAESGSNHVLEHMNKKTTVESLFAELRMFEKYNITCVLQTFLGHWSETFNDFVEHCEMFVNLLPYVHSGTISYFTLGEPFGLYEGTPSYEHRDKNQLVFAKENMNEIWLSKKNPDNTLKERIYRRLIMEKLAGKLNLPIKGQGSYFIFTKLNTIITTQRDIINDFYEKQI